jgi:hypothetical protein
MFAFCIVARKLASAQSSPSWTVGKPTLSVLAGDKSTLQVHLNNGKPRSGFELSASTALSSVESLNIYRDRLVVEGRAGNVSQVVIFDLANRKEIDSYYCYQPTYLGKNPTAYVEWSPNHALAKVTDVVLLYDLDLSPKDNRVSGEAINLLQPGKEVGFPIYPDINLALQSYANVVQEDSQVRHVIGLSPFVMLESKRLVFVSATGAGGFHTLFNYLVEVNLSNGLKSAELKTIPIPKETLKHPGENPNFIQVSDLKAVSRQSVSLSF